MGETASIRLSQVLREAVIPVLVEPFYNNGDGEELKRELQQLISEKSVEGVTCKFADFMELYSDDGMRESFEGLILFSANVMTIGYKEHRERLESMAREYCEKLGDDPIIVGRNEGGITEELYHSYAAYRVMELCLMVTDLLVGELIDTIPTCGEGHLESQLSEIPLCIAFGKIEEEAGTQPFYGRN